MNDIITHEHNNMNVNIIYCTYNMNKNEACIREDCRLAGAKNKRSGPLRALISYENSPQEPILRAVLETYQGNISGDGGLIYI